MKIHRYVLLVISSASFTAIAVLSLVPRPPDILDAFSYSDKIYHAAAYCFMEFFIFLTMRTYGAGYSKSLNLSLVFSLATGLVIEIIQPYFSRTGDSLDYLADAAGVLAGVYLAGHLVKSGFIEIEKKGVLLKRRTP